MGLKSWCQLCLLLATLLFLLSGCASLPPAPFPDTDLTPTRPITAAELSARAWTSGNGSYIVRQSALFEWMGKRVPMTGVMKLDLSRKEVRLVGMDDMGVKLYDLSVDPKESSTNFLMPELARFPGFPEAVASSVRRIYLAPEPQASDRLERTADRYLLSRDGEAGKLSFTFGGADLQMLEKSCQGSQSWRVRYYRYQPYLGRLFPGGIVLDDERAGYRLTLWTESVDQSDE